MTLSLPARRQLLGIARRAIEDHLRGQVRTPFGALSDELHRSCGAFVTLRRRQDRELRGCVGYIEPKHPLAETVALAAVAAATNDGRFDPVTLDELTLLALDVSVLGPTFPIRAAELVVGRHGLVIEKDGCRGLLLPQVAIEWGWDATTFLEQACRKAGLPTTAWRDQGALLSAFEAELLLEEC